MGPTQSFLRHLDCIAGHATPQRPSTTPKMGHDYNRTCSVLTKAFDAMEIDKIIVVGGCVGAFSRATPEDRMAGRRRGRGA